ncbi:hypothetical protein [Picosynechococcus sp. PCC 7002]|nr:hypothetical protein [Picosynechococcus sp. PCC 7002]
MTLPAIEAQQVISAYSARLSPAGNLLNANARSPGVSKQTLG